ncbi:MAG: alkaline phosphatase family protein [Myxococcota bacterium]
MPAKHLVIGLDGFDVDIIEGATEHLPQICRRMNEGAWARQRSVMPPATLPNWTTFLTGVDPGRHGVFDFTTRQGTRVSFTGGTVREAPTLAARLDRMGKRCALIGFPATYPPEPLEHGIFMSGWDAPVAFEDDASFVWPPSLHAQITRRFGKTQFDDVNEFDADRPGWHDALPAALVRRVQRKVRLCEWLLERESWDLFAVYFGESDTAGHHLWAHHDPTSPRRPAGLPLETPSGLVQVYAALDSATGALCRASGEDVELTVVSDHGSGGSSDRVLYLNRVLADAGLLSFRVPSPAERVRAIATSALKDAALRVLSPALRERIFRFGAIDLPGLLESQARFGAIDFSKTRAFSDELNYFPGVWINDAREAQGIVHDCEAARMETRAALLALRDPWDDEPVVTRVYKREELFDGPHVERAPDLLLELRLPEGYSYNMMPSASAPAGTGPFRRLDASEMLGRKGRSLAGSHRARGFFLASGPSVAATGEIDCAIADAAATLLARMGVAVPADASGRVLYEILEAMVDTSPLPAGAPPARVQSTSASVERRLRALGYID